MEVIGTNHAKEKAKDHNLPFSVVKNIVRNEKGLKFYDKKEETILYKYNKSVVVVDETKEDKKIIITVYRDSCQLRYSKDERFVPLS